MPEILDLKFNRVNKMDSITEDSEINADIANFGLLEATEDAGSDDKLRSITEMRGLFPSSPND
jgi:hypothetical protein